MAPSVVGNLSLEDIIRKNRTGQRFRQSNPNMNITSGRFQDARNKIILKKRTKIVDARDRLAELARRKDARLKLDQLRSKKFKRDRKLPLRLPFIGAPRDFGAHFKQNQPTTFIDLTRQVRSTPLIQSIAGNRLDIRSTDFRFQTSKNSQRAPNNQIVRVIDNDSMEYAPPIRDMFTRHYEEEPIRRTLTNRRSSLNFKIIAQNEDAKRRLEESNAPSILKKRLRDRSPSPRNTENLRIRVETSPTRPTSILKKRSMVADTIKPATKHEKRSEVPTEYRIIVSNLRSTVTGSDIRELFGDIGGLQESRLVRPGTAEVIYKTLEDAQRAVDLYHNRQLDGQPMNCLLVNPRPTGGGLSLGRPSSSKSLPSSNSTVSPDIAAFHKVLFNQY